MMGMEIPHYDMWLASLSEPAPSAVRPSDQGSSRAQPRCPILSSTVRYRHDRTVAHDSGPSRRHGRTDSDGVGLPAAGCGPLASQSMISYRSVWSHRKVRPAAGTARAAAPCASPLIGPHPVELRATSCNPPGPTRTPARARSGPHLALCAVRMQMPCPCRSNTAMRAACPASLQGQAAPPPAIVAGIGVPEGPPRLLRSFEWSSDVRRKVSALTAAKECGQTCQTSLRTKQEASFDRSGEKNDAGIGVFKAAAVSLHF